MLDDNDGTLHQHPLRLVAKLRRRARAAPCCRDLFQRYRDLINSGTATNKSASKP